MYGACTSHRQALNSAPNTVDRDFTDIHFRQAAAGQPFQRRIDMLPCFHCTFVMAVACMLSFMPNARSELLCKAGGYCSLGLQPSHYVGPISSNLELKAALLALHFRKEIILTSETRADPAAQFLASYQKAGYGHVLMMTDSEPLCRHLSTVFSQLGCGWYIAPTGYDPMVSSVFNLESTRYPKMFLGARIIRHGYNVLITDSGEISRDQDNPYVCLLVEA